MTSGWQGQHRDDGNNMGWRPQRPQVMGTTWGPSGGYGDNVGMTGMTWGQWGWCGDDGDNMGMTGTTGTMGTTWGGDNGGDHGDHSHGDNMGTFWGLWGQCGNDGDNTRMTCGWQGRRGQPGDHGDNKITKNAITFERIEIIEFCLKIWDPWTLPHTCTLQLMCRWGGVLSQIAFLSKKCSGDPQKFFFPVFALDPIRPYVDWALRGFLTSWPIYDPLKLQLKWKQSAKFD